MFRLPPSPPLFPYTTLFRSSYSAMLVAIGAGLTWRFARALNQVDSFAGQLVTRVREAEERLKASFAREEERARAAALRSEEHTSELQSRQYLVCRLLLEKKK